MSNKHEQLIELLRDVNRGMGKYVKDVLTLHDIPITMMMISKQIAAEPGITISELSRRTGMAKSHISNTIQELEQRGWVEKKADASDKRRLCLYLTSAATDHLGQVRIDIRHELKSLVSDLPEQRADELITGLGEIKLALERARYQASNYQGASVSSLTKEGDKS